MNDSPNSPGATQHVSAASEERFIASTEEFASESSRATVLGSNAPVDIQSAAIQAALAILPPPGAGPAQTQTLAQAQSVESAVPVVTPAVTSGGGRGCVGSPC